MKERGESVEGKQRAGVYRSERAEGMLGSSCFAAALAGTIRGAAGKHETTVLRVPLLTILSSLVPDPF